MALTDNELCMVEQLCYINKDLVKYATGKDYSPEQLAKNIAGMKDYTVGEILEKLGFTDKAIEKLSNMGDKEIDGACAEGKEWASILTYLKNSELSNLKLTATMASPNQKNTLAMCFEDPSTSEAIVAFKGTSGEQEWKDNVEGLNDTDTDCQKDALEFIESLPYDDITVTGHSKGGNKAMYVTILSDKVNRCVSYDGQGFSQEFLDKYWAEIQLRGGSITNYSVSTDFVHVLLFQIPNSTQKYCRGYGIENPKQNHSPNSFFQTDKDGNLILDKNGKPIVISDVKEDPSMTMLHQFTAFLLNNAPDGEKEMLVEYLAPLVGMAMSGNNDELLDKILSDPDALATVIAYLVKYMDEYDLDADDVDELLEALGLGALNEMVKLTDFSFLGQEYNVNLNLANILNLIKEQLSDKNDDWFLSAILIPILKKIFADDLDIDVTEFWQKINDKVKDIDTSGGRGDYTCQTGTTRDYSNHVYDTLMEAIDRIEAMGGSSLSNWKSFSGESWYSKLFVPIMYKAVSTYFSKLTETNQEYKTKIDSVFDNVATVDRKYEEKIRSNVTEVSTIRTIVAGLADSLHF